MKKISLMITMVVVAFAVFTNLNTNYNVEAVNNTTSVTVNGETMSFETSQQPIVENGRTLVPMRPIFEALGATIQSFDNRTKTVTAVKDGKAIIISAGMNVAHVRPVGTSIGIEHINLSHSAEIINGTTMVPLRFVSEALGAEVKWDNTTKTAHIRLTETTGQENVQTENFNYEIRNGTHVATYSEEEDTPPNEEARNAFAEYVIEKGAPIEKNTLLQHMEDSERISNKDMRFYEIVAPFNPDRPNPLQFQIEWK